MLYCTHRSLLTSYQSSDQVPSSFLNSPYITLVWFDFAFRFAIKPPPLDNWVRTISHRYNGYKNSLKHLCPVEYQKKIDHQGYFNVCTLSDQHMCWGIDCGFCKIKIVSDISATSVMYIVEKQKRAKNCANVNSNRSSLNPWLKFIPAISIQLYDIISIYSRVME